MLMILSTQCESKANVGLLHTDCLSEGEASAGFKLGRLEFNSSQPVCMVVRVNKDTFDKLIGTGLCASQPDGAADEARTSSASTASSLGWRRKAKSLP